MFAMKQKIKGAIAQYKQELAVVAGASVAAVGTSANAQAVAVDLTSLTSAVDFSTTGAAILLVAAALLAVYITIKAAGFVIGMVRRA